MSTAYRAKRLPKLSGPAAWNEILGPRQPFAVPEGRQAFDFAIVGGGFAGLSAARRLKQLAPEASIAIIEATEIAKGSAGRNSGFMIDLPHELTSEDYAGKDSGSDKSMTALNRQAIAFGEAAVGDYGISREYFRRDGKINGAASDHADRQNKSYARHLKSLGEGYELLDAQAMKALTGSSHYISGLYTPGTVMLQPAGYVRGLADGLHRDGVSIFENTPVLELARSGSGWSIDTQHGRLDAGTVIMANNGQIESFGFARGRLMHIFLFACMTEELSNADLNILGGEPCWGITPSDPMGTTLRRISTGQGGNRIISRTMARFTPSMVTTPGEFERARKVMREKFDQRFPQLRRVKMDYVWNGHLCLAKNNVSLATKLDENLFAAAVQNGLGTTRGTLTGIAAAEKAVGATSDITQFFDAQEPPQPLPPAPLAKLGANLFIGYKEWRAHNE